MLYNSCINGRTIQASTICKKNGFTFRRILRIIGVGILVVWFVALVDPGACGGGARRSRPTSPDRECQRGVSVTCRDLSSLR